MSADICGWPVCRCKSPTCARRVVRFAGWVAVHEDGTRIPLDADGSYRPDRAGTWRLESPTVAVADLNHSPAIRHMVTYNEESESSW